MSIYPSDDGAAAFVRLARGDDLLEELNAVAAEIGLDAATVQIVGAVERLAVAYYRQDIHEYEPHEHDGPHEIAGGVGNVSLKDGTAVRAHPRHRQRRRRRGRSPGTSSTAPACS